MSLPIIPHLAVTLVACFFVNTAADKNITLISFPVNVTSWKRHLQDKLSHPLRDVRSKMRTYVDYVNNGSVSCVEEGGECSTTTSNCCSDSNDLECLPAGDSGEYVCRRLQSSEELAGQRLRSLQYGDSKGVMNSHPWVDSWEFQSKSTMEREEEKAAADSEFTRNFKPTNEDNIWKKVYTNIKNGGDKLWHDLKKLEKLREIKNSLIERYKKNYQNKNLSADEEVTSYPTQNIPETPPDEPEEIPSGAPSEEERIVESISDDSWLYPSDTYDNERGSEEFKTRKRKEKRIDFRIEDIISDIANLLSKKLNKNLSEKSWGSPSTVVKDSLNRNNVMDSAERLKKEINELKLLKEKRNKSMKEDKPDKSINNDELIKKHVAVILDEERKLDKLKKLEQFKKLQELG